MDSYHTVHLDHDLEEDWCCPLMVLNYTWLEIDLLAARLERLFYQEELKRVHSYLIQAVAKENNMYIVTLHFSKISFFKKGSIISHTY